MDDIQKEALISEFRAYLEAADLPDATTEETEPSPDLHTLLSELAALRTEVRTQSRQFKGSLDQFREVFDTLRAETARRAADQHALRREVLRPVLLQILDVRDRIVKGLEAVAALPPPPWWCREERHIVDSLRTGQEMSLRRLDQLIYSHQVRPIEAIGKPHDPFTMTVVEVENRANLASGIVTEEVRRGFLWGEELLRPADVKVNRSDNPISNINP